MDQLLYLAVLPLGALVVGALGLLLNRWDVKPQASTGEAEELRELSERVALLENSLEGYKSRLAAVHSMAVRDPSGRFVAKSRRPEAKAALARSVAAE